MVRHLMLGFMVASWLAVGAATGASAQAPDMRDIRPIVMLLTDTSGSMERLPSCVCRTPGCAECFPRCSSSPGESDRNRWAVVLEALTGTFRDYTCSREDRNTAAYLGQYDYGYYIPHFRPGYSAQLTDGILDSYVDRVKFGLMTFDGIGTFTDSKQLVTEREFRARLSDSRGAMGDFSYGEPRPFSLPGCAQPYMLDNGARNESASVGRLVSVGNDRTDDPAAINADIQNVLLSVRPFGATPIAGMLDDVRYYFNNHPDAARPALAAGDPYFQCRSRYVLLLTDGYPNADMRGDPYNCDAAGSSCPYDRAEDIAADLCRMSRASGECEGLVDGIFVVGFNIADREAIARLNGLASLGGTGAALFADDRATLLARLSTVLDTAAPGATTRTVPAFTKPLGRTNGAQYQFNTGFVVGSEDGTEPWKGVLERRRFLCDGLVVEEQPITDADRFHETLNRASPTACTEPWDGSCRRLLTVVPRRPRDVDEHLVGQDMGIRPIPAGSIDVPTRRRPAGCDTYRGPAEEGLRLRAFDRTIAPEYFGLRRSDSTTRDRVVDWVYGVGRENAKLGDIYHSSPVVVGPPTEDLPDESYNQFRQRPEVANRPTVVYVATNDGVIHAFAAEDATLTRPDGTTVALSAGAELWGFIPPVVFPKLPASMSSHQYMVDGTPLVKDVFLQRRPGTPAGGGIWRTVMIVPLGRGGGGYVALDVTDPLDPGFLWQFNHPDMGPTLGAPGLGQVLVNAGGEVQERALALLPAGAGPGEGPCGSVRGRGMFFVDPATGQLVKVVDDTTFNAPLTGGLSLYSGDVATVATRAFLTDDHGVIWRLDLASPNIADWDAVPFHDIFRGGAAADRQPAYYPPVLSTDADGRVVVIQATGNIDALEGLAANRVVSLTEQLDFDATTGVTAEVRASLNWEIRLDPGEQVTGPLELFQGNVYFGSFKSTSSDREACAYGFSRIWGVHYRDSVAGFGGVPEPKPGFDEDSDGVPETSFLGPFGNQIVMGVAVTQRPSCFQGEVVTDFYSGSYYRVTASEPGRFQLVAQVSGNGARPAGGLVGEIVRQLPSPRSNTLALSWAGTVD